MVLWLRFLTEINSNTKEESGDVDYEYHHIIKGLYATCSSWHIDPCRFPVRCGGILSSCFAKYIGMGTRC